MPGGLFVSTLSFWCRALPVRVSCVFAEPLSDILVTRRVSSLLSPVSCQLSGVFKAAPLRVNPRLRLQHSVFRTFVNLIHAQKDTRDGSAAFSLHEDPAGRPEDAAVGGVAGADAAAATAAAVSSGGLLPAGVGEGEELQFSPEMEAKIQEISRRPVRVSLLHEVKGSPRSYALARHGSLYILCTFPCLGCVAGSASTYGDKQRQR